MKKKNIHIDKHAISKKPPLDLADVKMKNPFMVPDDYFDKLPTRIVEIVNESSAKQKSTARFDFFIQKRWAYMGGIAALLIFMFFLLKPSNQSVEFDNGLTLEQIFDENPEWFDYMSDEEFIEALYVISDNTMEFDDDLLNFDSIPTDVLNSTLDAEGISYDLLYNL